VSKHPTRYVQTSQGFEVVVSSLPVSKSETVQPVDEHWWTSDAEVVVPDGAIPSGSAEIIVETEEEPPKRSHKKQPADEPGKE
jgi:hypothetical protein